MSARQINIYLSLILAGLVFLWWSSNQTPKYLQVSFLDVGQGDAILFRTPQGANILVDGGPDNSLLFQLAEHLPWWDRQIDYLIITHWDDDHFIGTVQLLKKYNIKQVLVSFLPDMQSPSYHAWQAIAQSRGLTPELARVGQEIKISADLKGKVLSAINTSEFSNNEKSLVIRWSYGSIDFLLMGDLPVEGEEVLLQENITLASEVLKVGHHGSKYSSSADFLARVHPELCIIEVGAENKFGHPNPDTLSRLQKAGCNTRETKDLGTITVWSDGQKWWVK